mgnify:CR=1
MEVMQDAMITQGTVMRKATVLANMFPFTLFEIEGNVAETTNPI